ncbi:MAG: dUTP diphosphatase [Candidatus Woesearchaeota archaeon]
MKIPIKRLDKTLPIPKHAREHDAGLDIYAAKDVLLKPHEPQIVPTGIQTAFPPGFVIHIWDRSSLAKKGVKTLGGVIDATYRGEYMVSMVNLTKEPISITKGDRIAQMVIVKHETIEFEDVDELDVTNRNQHGFGSTGR